MPDSSSLFFLPLILVSFFSLFTPWHPKLQSQVTDSRLPAHPGTLSKNGSKGTLDHFHFTATGNAIGKKSRMSDTHVYIPLKIYIQKTCISKSKWSQQSCLQFSLRIKHTSQPITVSGKHCIFSFLRRNNWEIENETSEQVCIFERRREKEGRRIYFICLLAWKMDAAVVQLCSCSLSQFVVFILFFMISSHILTVNLKRVQAASFTSLALNHDLADTRNQLSCFYMALIEAEK